MPDPQGYLLPGEREILLRRYAPVLVLFPEQLERAPYPEDGDAVYTMRGSYHPRSVELFLAHAKVRYHRNVLLRQPGLFFKPHSYAEEKEEAQHAVSEAEWNKAVEQYKTDPRYAGLGEAELRAAIKTRLVQERLSRRIRGFDLPLFRGHNLKQWQLYFRFLDEADPETRRATVYGRLLQGLGAPDQPTPEPSDVSISSFGPYDVSKMRIALQYWFQYYYDDWANRHEGDWEGITLLLDMDLSEADYSKEMDSAELLSRVTVRDVGYASHDDGYRRLWRDVQKTRDGRPIVYVARGSSASYFAWKPDGYPTSSRVGQVEKILAGIGAVLRGRRIFGRRWDAEFRARFTGRDPKNTDWVPADPRPDDRLDGKIVDRAELEVPSGCRGVRRRPDSGPQAGMEDSTYHLEMQDLFWLELVQEYGIQWGENYFTPGAVGPSGMSKAKRDKQRKEITRLAKIEWHVQDALSRLPDIPILPSDTVPELDQALRQLRPPVLRRQGCLPSNVRGYVYTMWAWILRFHREAWPGGPGLYLSLMFTRQISPWPLWMLGIKPRSQPLLDRKDPIFHLKTLLAMLRRTRYEIQHEGSKWDNPFAWVRHICRADTFFYGMATGQTSDTLDILWIDCGGLDAPET